MATLNFRASAGFLLFLCAAAAPILGQTGTQAESTQSAAQKPASPSLSKQPAAIKQPTAEEENRAGVRAFHSRQSIYEIEGLPLRATRLRDQLSNRSDCRRCRTTRGNCGTQKRLEFRHHGVFTRFRHCRSK